VPTGETETPLIAAAFRSQGPQSRAAALMRNSVTAMVQALKKIAARSNRMSEAKYECERAMLQETYGNSSAALQALAKLFYRSGWTPKELAKKEGRERSYIARKLLFGRFLDFVSTNSNAQKLLDNLTERRFRSCWVQTENGDEQDRFKELFRLLPACARRPSGRKTAVGHRSPGRAGAP
jgi:hypothetical protein